MFRKIFEKLLLRRYEGQDWARFHSCQTGFRRDYSIYSNAAIMYHLLSIGRRSSTVFLDFRAAFDPVDHTIPMEKLGRRGCPPSLLSLLYSLKYRGVRSRLFINGAESQWFARTRGVLQGSPLSSWMFNMFVDDLVDLMNEGYSGPHASPICLFYADDGAIMTDSAEETQRLLCALQVWYGQNGLELNVSKYGHISSEADPARLFVGDEVVRPCDSYSYLGFPMTSAGIDFAAHLRARLAAALRKSNWLALYSDGWGVSHRLRIFRQFLVPMFEYSTPLVHTWLVYTRVSDTDLRLMTLDYKSLIGWISNTTGRYKLVQNICGILPLRDRFEHLATRYYSRLREMSTNPLRDLMGRAASPSFLWSLGNGALFHEFLRKSNLEPTPRAVLDGFLRRAYLQKIKRAPRNMRMESLIPMALRKVPGLIGADVCLGVGDRNGDMLFKYRKVDLMFGSIYICGERFRRGHEECKMLRHTIPLRHHQRQ